MTAEDRPLALVEFAGAAEAARRIAGVAAAGRIVRELAEAGFAEAWLVPSDGRALPPGALDDARRLAGGMPIRIATAVDLASLTADRQVVRLPGNWLLPAAVLRQHLAGGTISAGEGIRLDRAGASAEILGRTAKATDGPVSRWLNRPVSRALSALLLRLPGIRPVHATFGTMLLAGLMFAALMTGGEWGLVAGGLLFHAASVFDGADGEIARATYRSSNAGAVLDSIVDVATTILFIAGVTVNLGSDDGDLAFALAGWGFLLFLIGLGAISWRASRTGGQFSLDFIKHHYRHRFAGRLVPLLIEGMTIVTSRDFFALLFALLILAGLPMAVLYLFAAAASLWILFVLASFLAPSGPPAARSQT
jgi:CDP-L-myo-inositol myo-inositolphosphotransferase